MLKGDDVAPKVTDVTAEFSYKTNELVKSSRKSFFGRGEGGGWTDWAIGCDRLCLEITFSSSRQLR